eukprot:CAMPEP_0115574096 /NCGR_PEP_ID=MMETSP0272-20121206/1345_1 /TAXON_ID=71861 /ORGANISM="Scrippsiella trochoidea, Strain CCMP3099" /LENGTH=39 /DNA_ID= /DNA_START= /DNA_END= /DNA_ORIENTATION=
MAKSEARVSESPYQEKVVPSAAAITVPLASNIIGGMSDM